MSSSSVSGYSPPPDQLHFYPEDLYSGASEGTSVHRPALTSSSSSPPPDRLHFRHEDVYRETSKGLLVDPSAPAATPAPPPYTPGHEHQPVPAGGTFNPYGSAPNIGGSVGVSYRPGESVLEWRGPGGDMQRQTLGVRNGSEEFIVSASKQRPFYKRPWFWLLLFGLILIIAAIIVPLYFFVIKKHHAVAKATGGPDSITGADGSLVYTYDNSTFVYSNPFGGFWYFDPEDPFNNNAQPNSWTPPLKNAWNFGTDRINGVNLRGLFIMEPLTTPALYEKYPASVDEWTLSVLMANDTASGGLNQIETVYNTFITEQDIAEIAGAGLNWIRLPIPYWAIDTWEGEPFLAKTSWKYILRILGWARKYGLRVNLDLHTIPGSQNGLNHSGKLGPVNFLEGVMGVANAQRTLDYIRIITEFISQPEWVNVVPIFSVMNEPDQTQSIGDGQMYSFYIKVHDMIRGITGTGEGNGPYIAISDGFEGVGAWQDQNIMAGADRVILDTHLYFAFNKPATSPIATGTGPTAGGIWPYQACSSWANSVNTSRENFGVTIAGEFTAGFNDCGLFVRGINDPAITTNCPLWQDHTQWNASIKAGVMAFTLASMDALQDYFFTTWKIGNSTSGLVQAPLWSYQLGLQYGWIPTDPRQAVGKCAEVGIAGAPFNGQYAPWQTGGSGAGTIVPSFVSQYGQWPPALKGGFNHTTVAASLLPMYTSTGLVASLPPLTLTASATHSISVGNGWFDPSDSAPGVTAIAGCTYPNAWSAVSLPIPTACGGTVAAPPAPTTAVLPHTGPGAPFGTPRPELNGPY